MSSLNYLSESLIIEALAKDDKKIAIADTSGIMSSIAGSIADFVKSMWNPDEPFSSIMAFMGPGLLFRLGMPWVSVIYTLAEVLGFDWIGFWHTVGEGIVDFVKGIKQSGGSVDENTGSDKVKTIVAQAMQQHFTGSPNWEKVKDIATNPSKYLSKQSDLQISFYFKKLAGQNKIVKNASIISSLIRFFSGKISWLIITALISLGFISAGGATKAIFNKTVGDEDSSSSGSSSSTISGNSPIYKLKMNPDATDLFEIHHNDMSSSWIEHGDISNIDDIIINWITELYPQLSQVQEEIKNSPTFQSVVSAFRNRNSLSAGTGIFSVPRPYERKADVVSPIVNDFIKANQ